MVTTYKHSGVDIDAGDALVERIKPFARATRTPEVIGDVGGFAGLCSLPSGLEDPVLVSGTDGVGTKLKLAFQTDRHDTIGFDLVGMCVNDILTVGARPLFFLDYFATGKLLVDTAEKVISGIARACQEAGCALLGGETAELPGMYAHGEYDLAGFAVGVVSRKAILDGSKVQAGDRAIALPSSGLHSNGYSLVRKILADQQIALSSTPLELGGEMLADALLKPTRIYAASVRALLSSGVAIHAMSHITGGGIPGNLPRVLPEGLGVRIARAWKSPPLFDFIQQRGEVEQSEMRRTFNCGVGYIFIVPPHEVDRAMCALREQSENPFELGVVESIPSSTPFEERICYPDNTQTMTLER